MPQPAVATAPDGSKWIYVIPDSFNAYQVVIVGGQPRLQARWQTYLGYPTNVGSPVVANGVVYVVGSAVLAYDAVTGALLWQSPEQIGSASRSSPLIVNGRLFVIGENAVDVFATDVIMADGFDPRVPPRPIDR
jgi:outer membrane protein assembly factor BamB